MSAAPPRREEGDVVTLVTVPRSRRKERCYAGHHATRKTKGTVVHRVARKKGTLLHSSYRAEPPTAESDATAPHRTSSTVTFVLYQYFSSI
ncbi:hypothetical protein SESBI_26338 [Sesbania bispinosa]|nr:hypothetical protein SESBI_26338 [Sesbania bispinosa]